MAFDAYKQLVWLWMALGAVAFFYLLRRNAPYGRHVQSGWGPTLDNRLGWFLMEFPVLAVFLGVLLGEKPPVSGFVWFFSGCFLLHYFNRVFVFPLRIRTGGKRMPWIIALSAICFNLVNGFLLGYYFAHFAVYAPGWRSDPRFLAGMALFWGGMALNWQSDNILIRLRKPGATGYALPQGGLFGKVSCPNHLGEIIEWTGFALMTWSLPALAFAAWTLANLVPRALAHHRWYRAHFPDYPEGRKALIPFLL